MSEKHLSRKPHESKDGAWWWYETRAGITVYTNEVARNERNPLLIPWQTIRAALKRKDRKP